MIKLNKFTTPNIKFFVFYYIKCITILKFNAILQSYGEDGRLKKLLYHCGNLIANPFLPTYFPFWIFKLEILFKHIIFTSRCYVHTWPTTFKYKIFNSHH